MEDDNWYIININNNYNDASILADLNRQSLEINPITVDLQANNSINANNNNKRYFYRYLLNKKYNSSNLPQQIFANVVVPAAVAAAAATADPEVVPAMTVRSADKFPKPITRTPTHPAAASAVSVARPDPAPYAGLSADHPGYDTGEDFRLEGHPPETFTPANGEAANGVDDDHVHIIPDDEIWA